MTQDNIGNGIATPQQSPTSVPTSHAGTTTLTMALETPEVDDFGLPIKPFPSETTKPPRESENTGNPATGPGQEPNPKSLAFEETQEPKRDELTAPKQRPEASDVPTPTSISNGKQKETSKNESPVEFAPHSPAVEGVVPDQPVDIGGLAPLNEPKPTAEEIVSLQKFNDLPTTDKVQGTVGEGDIAKDISKKDVAVTDHHTHQHAREESLAAGPGVSEFSHQHITEPKKKEENEEGEWQEMPAYASYDIYDDENRLIAKEHHETEEESYGYAGLGGAGKGYTRVLLDDDAESANSIDENTQYLFKNAAGTSMVDEDDQQRDAVSQLQATKDLLTEGQRIAYVGLTRLELSKMVTECEGADLARPKKPRKEVQMAAEAMKMWAQKMMIRLYSHMEISPAEQLMIEQLSEHGVEPADLKGALMQNARVSNPMREEEAEEKVKHEFERPEELPAESPAESPAEPPPAYEAYVHDGEEMPSVRTPTQLPTTQKIDIDLRWTVLCDLFLVLIADSVYDSRSRVLMEKVASDLEISWLDICRFEKRVTDALEMQQQAEKENWNEAEHTETRRKAALKRRYVMMGLATVGGGLVIGLSAGLMAPLIGAGLAAGFATVGVGGTSGFLAGTAGAAVITSGAAVSGSYIGGKAANRRTGAVKTFEYRPLHNNKKVNLIVTVSGWLTGKVDDVRLPFSTVDPVMGDIYSILWEPEMLTSMGDTINILATEALTQGLQQVLGSTILISLMAALQLPIVLTKLSYLIDNPWAVSLDRATAAGLILADSLIERNLGTRPVTLVGYSLGSRVIFSCLQELSKKGAYGLVQNVYMFGSPMVVKKEEYLRARSVVAGRFVNGFNRNDWILGYLFRLTNGGIRRIAGLASVDEIADIENIDVTDYVVGHMDYRQAMPRILRELCGWMVESDEFTEIEDPDPENHKERQRELINEIEEAREKLQKEGEASKKKSRFSLFGRKKKLEKAEWEVYQDAAKQTTGLEGVAKSNSKTEDAEGNNHGILFDVDAIRAELAKEASREKKAKDQEVESNILQAKEIESTLPPMKLDVSCRASTMPALPSTRVSRTSYDTSPGNSYRPSFSGIVAHGEGKSTSSFQLYNDYLGPQGSDISHGNASPRPPPPKSPAHLYGNDCDRYGQHGGFEENEGEISMTFDTSFRDPSPPPPPAKDYYQAPTSSLTVTDHTRVGNNNSADAGSARPGIRTANTEPAGVPSAAAANPWMDDEFDDPDFGKEKEISMTFA